MPSIPLSDDCESALIGALIHDPNQIDAVIGIVSENDFALEPARIAYAALCRQHESGVGLDLRELVRSGRAAQIEGFTEWLGRTSSAGIPSSAPRYADEVHYRSVARQLFNAASEYQRRIEKIVEFSPGEVTEATAWLQAKIQQVMVDRGGKSYRSITELNHEALDAIEMALRADNAMGIATGFQEVDGTFGGLFAGELTTLAARPGIGKTSLGLQIASHVAKTGGRSLVFSLEMTGKELAQRNLCSYAEVSNQYVRCGVVSPDERDRLVAAGNEMSEMSLYVDDRSTLTVQQIAATSRMFAAAGGVDLIVVDYIGLIRPSEMTKGLRRHDQLSEITKTLKAVAKELDCCVLALSQVNREAAKEGWLRLHHLKESGSIEEDSNSVWFIQSSEEKVEIEVAKNRNGSTGVVEMVWEPKYTRFRDRGAADMKNYDHSLAEYK